jgi:hypothetical protein
MDLAARHRPTDTLKTIEDPRTVVSAFGAAMWASIPNTPPIGIDHRRVNPARV